MTTRQEALEALKLRVPKFAATAAPVYALLKWEWSGDGVPSATQIEASCLKRISDLEKAEWNWSRSGGITVLVEEDSQGDWEASLVFWAVSASSDFP